MPPQPRAREDVMLGGHMLTGRVLSMMLLHGLGSLPASLTCARSMGEQTQASRAAWPGSRHKVEDS